VVVAVRDVHAVRRLGTVLGVWAHPDDEAYCSAGLMAAARRAGNRVVCVTATRGEARAPADERTRELGRALAVLGVEEHVVLDHPDGRCHEVEPADAIGGLREIIADVRPATVLTFGTDGLTGHSDHATVGRWTVAALAGTQAVVHAVTRTALWVEEFVTPFEPTGIFRRAAPVSTPVDELSIHLELTGALLQGKEAAVRCHGSQVDAVRRTLGADVFRKALAEETFRVVPT
jgi:LmbE family N-acetylglucosaminyl deacetylase